MSDRGTTCVCVSPSPPSTTYCTIRFVVTGSCQVLTGLRSSLGLLTLQSSGWQWRCNATTDDVNVLCNSNIPEIMLVWQRRKSIKFQWSDGRFSKSELVFNWLRAACWTLRFFIFLYLLFRDEAQSWAYYFITNINSSHSSLQLSRRQLQSG